MKLSISKSKNSVHYYVAESFRIDGKSTTKTIYKIGSHEELLKQGHSNPEEYARNYVKEQNEKLKNSKITFSKTVDFLKNLEESSEATSESLVKNTGWLYLNSIIKKLGLNEVFDTKNSKIHFNLEEILRYLIVDRILFPTSKKGSYQNLSKYFSNFNFELHDIYRALDWYNKFNEEIQIQAFNKTKELVKLDTQILYYDCTNFYFETEVEDENTLDDEGDIIQRGLRRYGASKEHRPNPIVQMGLFTEKNGIPISYTIEHGSNNEQNTVIPMVKRMHEKYKTSKFIYCSDAGLGSYDNRFFSTLNKGNYIVTQSLKKTPKKELDLIFKDLNWRYVEDDTPVSLDNFKRILDKQYSGNELSEEEKKYIKSDMIYKKFPIKRNIPGNFVNEKLSGTLMMEETVFITFSAKYYLYQTELLNKQILRADKTIQNKSKLERKNPNDPNRLIAVSFQTENGEIANNFEAKLDDETIKKERTFHGFYAVATSLDKEIKEILNINSNRWQIEQNFRIMKSEFKSRPVFASTEEHIKAHFLICYLALLTYKILEQQLKIQNEDSNLKITTTNILKTLKNVGVIKQEENYYQATYTHSKILQLLEKVSNRELDCQYYSESILFNFIQKIINNTTYYYFSYYQLQKLRLIKENPSKESLS